MLKKFKIFIWTLILFGSVSCVDNDNIGPIEKVNFLQFDFPQGNALWDKEIEQIAKDWGNIFGFGTRMAIGQFGQNQRGR